MNFAGTLTNTNENHMQINGFELQKIFITVLNTSVSNK